MSAEFRLIPSESLTVQELIVLACEFNQWLRPRTPLTARLLHPDIDLSVDSLVNSLDENYPKLETKTALCRARDEMARLESELTGINLLRQRIESVACQNARTAVGRNCEDDTKLAATRAAALLTQDVIHAVSWDLARKEGIKDQSLHNPFEHLLMLYGLGVAKVWVEGKIGNKIVTSVPVNSPTGPVLASRVYGCKETYAYQSWRQQFPNREDLEIDAEIQRLAISLGFQSSLFNAARP